MRLDSQQYQEVFCSPPHPDPVSIPLYGGYRYRELFPREEADYNSPVPGAKVKDAQSYAFTVLYTFMAEHLSKQMYNFILFTL
jgi:hypothetical protein